jgi:cytochrome c oxidase subunit II
VVADENYLHESIVNPGAKVVAGFDNVMPTYAGSLSDREISALIAYIKTL